MSTILNDFSDSALAHANEANLEGCFCLLRHAPNVECYDGPEMLRICTGVPFFFVNTVLRTRLDSTTLDGWVEPTLSYFRARQLPMSWMVSPSTQPADLDTHLLAHGLTLLESMPGMAIDLQILPESIPRLPDVTIVEVVDRPTLEHWLHASSTGYGIPLEVMELFAQAGAALGAEAHLSFRSFVAYRKGQPVGTSSLYLGAGVAGIYCVAVVPEARRMGIGAAITAAPLQIARELGYRIGILQASAMGEPVYRRLGFHEHGRFNLYG